jgi:hypothetical protein
MMKRLLIALFCASIILPLQAQDEPSSMPTKSPKVVYRLSILSPKLIAEIAPADNFTIVTGFWVRTSLWTTNSSGQLIYRPLFAPSFTVEPRYYFNLDTREAKGKRTDYYSGWYLSAPFNMEFPDLRYSMGATIGFQCTMGKRWYWSISMGPGITYDDGRVHPDGAGDLTLGIILNKM